MERAVAFRTIMNGPYREHPTEDALERFLLNQSGEDELDVVETHIIACETCVTRLETLEFNIEATKLALRGLEAEQAQKRAQPESTKRKFFGNWLSWMTVPHLSFAGASLATCAVALTFISIPRDVTVTAYRGAETNIVSQWLPLKLHLNATDLPIGSVIVHVVDSQGAKVWQGAAAVKDNRIDVKIPRLTAAANYLVQVYSAQEASSASLLREFSIKAKPLF